MLCRWRGENVSTNEVEATISNILDQKDATVYGVEVSDNDGKAGMVAIPAMDGDEDVDLDKLVMGVMKELPAYARPIFVRLVKKRLDLTGEILGSIATFFQQLTHLLHFRHLQAQEERAAERGVRSLKDHRPHLLPQC